MAFTTDAAVESDVAAALKTTTANLPDWTDTVIARCHTAAYQEIVGRLLGRGYTKAVIDTWDRGVEFERAIALYLIFSQPQALGVFDKQAMEVWGQYRKDLLDVVLFVSGTPVSPGTGPTAGGTVGSGDVSTANDLFTLDPDDANRGEITRW